MNAQLAAFQTQAQRGQERSREEIYSGEITFTGHSAIACSVRAGISTAVLELGFELSEPHTFHVLSTDVPVGVTITPKTTRFTYASRTWRVVSVLSRATEPQIRFIADLATAPSRG